MLVLCAVLRGFQVTLAELAQGAVYPGLGRLREVSIAIAVAVSDNMYHTDRATKPLPLSNSERHRPGDADALARLCREAMYTPAYQSEEDSSVGARSTPPMCVRSRL